MSLAIVNGTPVNFSFQTAAGITITGFSGILLQSADFSKVTTRTLVKDGDGQRTSSIHSDPVNELTLRWKVSGSSLSAAITNTTITAPGNFIIVTGCAGMPDAIATWEVISCNEHGKNDDVAELDYKLEKAPLITAVAT